MQFHPVTIGLALFLAALFLWLNSGHGYKEKSTGEFQGYVHVRGPGFPFAKYEAQIVEGQEGDFDEKALIASNHPARIQVWQYGNPLVALIVILGIPYWYERGLRRRIREREEREAQTPIHY